MGGNMTNEEFNLQHLPQLIEMLHRLTDGNGCGDSHCRVKLPKGMCTNGGCRCLRQLYEVSSEVAGALKPVYQQTQFNLRDKLKVFPREQ